MTFADRELALMASVEHHHEDDMPQDALDHADCVGLMQEDVSELDGIYQRAGFDCATHVDAAIQHTCQLSAGMSLLYPEEV